MPGYLIDEGGERTHAVVPIEEYERLRTAVETLEAVRGYAHEMAVALDVTGTDGVAETASGRTTSGGSPWNQEPSRKESDWPR